MSYKYSERIKEYFKKQIKYDYETDIHSSNTKAVIKIQHELIIEQICYFSKTHEVHFLDIGCGWGDFSNKLSDYIDTYVGIEPSFNELNRFKKMKGRYLVSGVGEYLDYLKDNSRNVVLLNSVLDHCFDYKRTFENLKRVLCPGGLIIISMENFSKIPIEFKKILGIKIVHDGHVEAFTIDDIDILLKDNFSILKRKTIGFLFGFHKITKIIPIPVRLMYLLNKIFDMLFSKLYPLGGHILFYSALYNKRESRINLHRPLRCPKCKEGVDFYQKICENCKFEIPYLNYGKILDSLKINKILIDDIPY